MTLTPEALEEIKARAANANGLFTANGRNAEDVTESASRNTLVSLGDEEGYIWVQVTENGGGETALDNVVSFIERGPSDALDLLSELKRLKGRVGELEGALEPFGRIAKLMPPESSSGNRDEDGFYRYGGKDGEALITFGDLRRAAALSKGEG